MSLPPNFGQAFDLSSLTKPKADPSVPMPGIEVTVENLSNSDKLELVNYFNFQPAAAQEEIIST